MATFLELLTAGTRVQYSDERLHSFRMNHSGFHYASGPQRASADEQLESLRAERGVIIEASHGSWDGVGRGYTIRWEAAPRYAHGYTSRVMPHVVEAVAEGGAS